MVDVETVDRVCARKFRLFAAICFVLVLLTAYALAQSGKRLILKDGTWQDITQYEVQGDRARYFSSQRGEWEELPKELVDWKATEEWNAGLKDKSKELRQLDADDAGDEQEAKAEAAKGPMVMPGLKLPLTGGVFMLDMLAGQPSLNELTQNESKVNGDLRSAINRKAYFKQEFELRGPHARVQAHASASAIFVNIDTKKDPIAQQITLADRFRVLRLESKNDSRVLASVEVSVLGKQNQSQQAVSTRVESFGEGWLKIIPLETLEPGEYALVEMLGQSEFNSYVWDFGVDPNAPANPNALKPESIANDNTSGASPEVEPLRK